MSKKGYKLQEIERNAHLDISVVIPRFCGNCEYLTPTEKEQTNSNEIHWCTKYNKQVKHNGYHPELPRLDKCNL